MFQKDSQYASTSILATRGQQQTFWIDHKT